MNEQKTSQLSLLVLGSLLLVRCESGEKQLLTPYSTAELGGGQSYAAQEANGTASILFNRSLYLFADKAQCKTSAPDRFTVPVKGSMQGQPVVMDWRIIGSLAHGDSAWFIVTVEGDKDSVMLSQPNSSLHLTDTTWRTSAQAGSRFSFSLEQRLIHTDSISNAWFEVEWVDIMQERLSDAHR